MHALDLQFGPRVLHKLESLVSLVAVYPTRNDCTVCYLDKLVFCTWILVLVWVIFATETLVGFSYVLLRGMFRHWTRPVSQEMGCAVQCAPWTDALVFCINLLR